METPLYLAEVRLDAGAILDLLGSARDPNAAMLDGGYLDIDLLGPIEGVKPAHGATSSVHVFGITLQRMPVEFALAPSQPGNIFCGNEIPETAALINATQPGRTTLTWRITDVTGGVVCQKSADFRLEAAGEVRRQTIPLEAPRPGWYGVRFALASPESAAELFLVHEAAFALLGPDRRKAGYDSPYGVWWFGEAHYGCDDVPHHRPAVAQGRLPQDDLRLDEIHRGRFCPLASSRSRSVLRRSICQRHRRWRRPESCARLPKRFPRDSLWPTH